MTKRRVPTRAAKQSLARAGAAALVAVALFAAGGEARAAELATLSLNGETAPTRSFNLDPREVVWTLRATDQDGNAFPITGVEVTTTITANARLLSLLDVSLDRRDAADGLSATLTLAFAVGVRGNDVQVRLVAAAADVSAVATMDFLASPVVVGFLQTEYEVSESGGSQTVCVTLLSGHLSHYADAPNPEIMLVTGPGTANSGTDYNTLSQTLRFSGGMIERCADIAIVDDDIPEDTETFFASIQFNGWQPPNPRDRDLMTNPDLAVIQITDDDTAQEVTVDALPAASFASTLLTTAAVDSSTGETIYGFVLTDAGNADALPALVERVNLRVGAVAQLDSGMGLILALVRDPGGAMETQLSSRLTILAPGTMEVDAPLVLRSGADMIASGAAVTYGIKAWFIVEGGKEITDRQSIFTIGPPTSGSMVELAATGSSLRLDGDADPPARRVTMDVVPVTLKITDVWTTSPEADGTASPGGSRYVITGNTYPDMFLRVRGADSFGNADTGGSIDPNDFLEPIPLSCSFGGCRYGGAFAVNPDGTGILTSASNNPGMVFVAPDRFRVFGSPVPYSNVAFGSTSGLQNSFGVAEGGLRDGARHAIGIQIPGQDTPFLAFTVDIVEAEEVTVAALPAESLSSPLSTAVTDADGAQLIYGFVMEDDGGADILPALVERVNLRVSAGSSVRFSLTLALVREPGDAETLLSTIAVTLSSGGAEADASFALEAADEIASGTSATYGVKAWFTDAGVVDGGVFTIGPPTSGDMVVFAATGSSLRADGDTDPAERQVTIDVVAVTLEIIDLWTTSPEADGKASPGGSRYVIPGDVFPDMFLQVRGTDTLGNVDTDADADVLSGLTGSLGAFFANADGSNPRGNPRITFVAPDRFRVQGAETGDSRSLENSFTGVGPRDGARHAFTLIVLPAGQAIPVYPFAVDVVATALRLNDYYVFGEDIPHGLRTEVAFGAADVWGVGFGGARADYRLGSLADLQAELRCIGSNCLSVEQTMQPVMRGTSLVLTIRVLLNDPTRDRQAHLGVNDANAFELRLRDSAQNLGGTTETRTVLVVRSRPAEPDPDPELLTLGVLDVRDEGVDQSVGGGMVSFTVWLLSTNDKAANATLESVRDRGERRERERNYRYEWQHEIAHEGFEVREFRQTAGGAGLAHLRFDVVDVDNDDAVLAKGAALDLSGDGSKGSLTVRFPEAIIVPHDLTRRLRLDAYYEFPERCDPACVTDGATFGLILNSFEGGQGVRPLFRVSTTTRGVDDPEVIPNTIAAGAHTRYLERTSYDRFEAHKNPEITVSVQGDTFAILDIRSTSRTAAATHVYAPAEGAADLFVAYGLVDAFGNVDADADVEYATLTATFAVDLRESDGATLIGAATSVVHVADGVFRVPAADMFELLSSRAATPDGSDLVLALRYTLPGETQREITAAFQVEIHGQRVEIADVAVDRPPSHGVATNASFGLRLVGVNGWLDRDHNPFVSVSSVCGDNCDTVVQSHLSDFPSFADGALSGRISLRWTPTLVDATQGGTIRLRVQTSGALRFEGTREFEVAPLPVVSNPLATYRLRGGEVRTSGEAATAVALEIASSAGADDRYAVDPAYDVDVEEVRVQVWPADAAGHAFLRFGLTDADGEVAADVRRTTLMAGTGAAAGSSPVLTVTLTPRTPWRAAFGAVSELRVALRYEFPGGCRASACVVHGAAFNVGEAEARFSRAASERVAPADAYMLTGTLTGEVTATEEGSGTRTVAVPAERLRLETLRVVDGPSMGLELHPGGGETPVWDVGAFDPDPQTAAETLLYFDRHGNSAPGAGDLTDYEVWLRFADGSRSRDIRRASAIELDSAVLSTAGARDGEEIRVVFGEYLPGAPGESGVLFRLNVGASRAVIGDLELRELPPGEETPLAEVAIEFLNEPVATPDLDAGVYTFLWSARCADCSGWRMLDGGRELPVSVAGGVYRAETTRTVSMGRHALRGLSVVATTAAGTDATLEELILSVRTADGRSIGEKTLAENAPVRRDSVSPSACAGAIDSVDDLPNDPAARDAAQANCLRVAEAGAFGFTLEWDAARDRQFPSDALTELENANPYSIYYRERGARACATPQRPARDAALPTGGSATAEYTGVFAVSGRVTETRLSAPNIRAETEYCLLLEVSDGAWADWAPVISARTAAYDPSGDADGDGLPDHLESEVNHDGVVSYLSEICGAVVTEGVAGAQDCDLDGVPDAVELRFGRETDVTLAPPALKCRANGLRTRLATALSSLDCRVEGGGATLAEVVAAIGAETLAHAADNKAPAGDPSLVAVSVADPRTLGDGEFYSGRYWLSNDSLDTVTRLDLWPAVDFSAPETVRLPDTGAVSLPVQVRLLGVRPGGNKRMSVRMRLVNVSTPHRLVDRAFDLQNFFISPPTTGGEIAEGENDFDLQASQFTSVETARLEVRWRDGVSPGTMTRTQDIRLLAEETTSTQSAISQTLVMPLSVSFATCSVHAHCYEAADSTLKANLTGMNTLPVVNVNRPSSAPADAANHWTLTLHQFGRAPSRYTENSTETRLLGVTGFGGGALRVEIQRTYSLPARLVVNWSSGCERGEVCFGANATLFVADIAANSTRTVTTQAIEALQGYEVGAHYRADAPADVEAPARAVTPEPGVKIRLGELAARRCLNNPDACSGRDMEADQGLRLNDDHPACQALGDLSALPCLDFELFCAAGSENCLREAAADVVFPLSAPLRADHWLYYSRPAADGGYLRCPFVQTGMPAHVRPVAGCPGADQTPAFIEAVYLDRIHAAPDSDAAACPTVNDPSWRPLAEMQTQGADLSTANCLRVAYTDNGPNDAAPEVGLIADPMTVGTPSGAAAAGADGFDPLAGNLGSGAGGGALGVLALLALALLTLMSLISLPSRSTNISPPASAGGDVAAKRRQRGGLAKTLAVLLALAFAAAPQARAADWKVFDDAADFFGEVFSGDFFTEGAWATGLDLALSGFDRDIGGVQEDADDNDYGFRLRGHWDQDGVWGEGLAAELWWADLGSAALRPDGGGEEADFDYEAYGLGLTWGWALPRFDWLSMGGFDLNPNHVFAGGGWRDIDVADADGDGVYFTTGLSWNVGEWFNAPGEEWSLRVSYDVFDSEGVDYFAIGLTHRFGAAPTRALPTARPTDARKRLTRRARRGALASCGEWDSCACQRPINANARGWYVQVATYSDNGLAVARKRMRQLREAGYREVGLRDNGRGLHALRVSVRGDCREAEALKGRLDALLNVDSMLRGWKARPY